MISEGGLRLRIMQAGSMGMGSLGREDLPRVGTCRSKLGLPRMGICGIVPDLPGVGILQHKAGSARKDRWPWLGLAEDESISLR